MDTREGMKKFSSDFSPPPPPEAPYLAKNERDAPNFLYAV
jgi:hypothetical protein